MVGGTSEIGAQQLLAGRCCIAEAICFFERDEYRIDFGQDLRVGDLEHPALLRLVIVVENAEVPNLRFPAAISFAPRIKAYFVVAGRRAGRS
jgi:hypothetical protein